MPCESREALSRWVRVYLGIYLPDHIVDIDPVMGSNCTPLDMVWEAYDTLLRGPPDQPRTFLFYAARASFKTLGFAIFQTLAILHCDSDVVFMAATDLQAAKPAEYVRGFFDRPFLRDWKVGDNLREQRMVMYVSPGVEPITVDEYKALGLSQQMKYEKAAYKAIVIPATMRAANSQHALTLCVDELDVIQDVRAFREAKLIPTPSKGRLPITVMTSSRKFATGLVQDLIDEAPKTRLQLRHWGVLEITERCPPERHRPELPKQKLFRSDDLLRVVKPEEYKRLDPTMQKKYAEAEVFAGCASCELYAPCRGTLINQESKSNLLRSIPYTIQLFRDTDTGTALAQLLSRKPMTTGLIYSQLDPQRHRLSAEQIVEMVTGKEPVGDVSFDDMVRVLNEAGATWWGGMDFGYSDPWAVVIGVRFGETMFVVAALEVPGLDPGQQVGMANQYIRRFDPRIYPDTENPQMIATFKKAGYRMAEWKKGQNSVLGGINLVRLKVAPFNAAPQLYFLAGEPTVERLFEQLAKYSWKLSMANEPTDVPNDKDDHLPDALRYMVMNVFARSGAGIVTMGDGTAATAAEPKGPGPEKHRIAGTQVPWMKDLIGGMVGRDPDEEEPEQPQGEKKGGITWSM